MKQSNITFPFDEEKAKATRMYMKQKNVKLEEELVRAMEMLYTKTVPSSVREFIDMRTGIVIEKKDKR